MFFTDLIIVTLKCGFELNFCGWKNDSFTRMKYISSNNTLIPSPGDSYGGTLLSLQIYYKIICRVGVANNENLISFKSYFCWKRVRWNMKKFVIILQKVIDLDTQKFIQIMETSLQNILFIYPTTWMTVLRPLPNKMFMEQVLTSICRSAITSLELDPILPYL